MVLSKAQRERLPSTLARSPTHAQEIYVETLESAEKTHGDGEAAHRIAFSALKHSFEKVGDHWEKKAKKGPSDARAARSGRAAREGRGEPAGGVDANASKAHLLDVAKRLEVKGRTRMKKSELVEAIGRANARTSARSLRQDRS